MQVQYAAADPPKSAPAGYAVRHDELMSADHSLSSVKSRQAKIVSSSGTRSTGDDASLKSPNVSSKSLGIFQTCFGHLAFKNYSWYAWPITFLPTLYI